MGLWDGAFRRWGVYEMGSLGDDEFRRWGVWEMRSIWYGEFRRWGVYEMGSSGDGEFMRWGVHEMGSLGDEEFMRWGVQEMESLWDGEFRRWGVYEMGSLRIKLLGSNPGSLLRSKSTRHETSCEAACEWLVYINSFIFKRGWLKGNSVKVVGGGLHEGIRYLVFWFNFNSSKGRYMYFDFPCRW